MSFPAVYSAAFNYHLTQLCNQLLTPCNIAVYSHSKNPILHSISRTSCHKNEYIYTERMAVFMRRDGRILTLLKDMSD